MRAPEWRKCSVSFWRRSVWVTVIFGCARSRLRMAIAVAAYIAGAYWFTASTSFANPAVTLDRAATGTFAGIRALDAPAFIMAQIAGAGAATVLSLVESD